MVGFEWVGLATLLLAVIGNIVKGYMDKASVEIKVEALEKWRTKMEAVDIFTSPRCMQERSDCRVEIFKDINRVEKRFDDFLKVVETQNTRIGEVRDHVVRILTILESDHNTKNNKNVKVL